MQLDFSKNHFALFDLPVAFNLDTAVLDQSYRDIQAQIHPDKFAHAGEAEQRLSMQWTTRVNEAYQTLKKPFERARYVLLLQGIDAMDPKNTSMPAAFLMQQMEWREALETAMNNRDISALQALENALRNEAKMQQGHLHDQLDLKHDYAAATEALRKMRFMDKLLEEIDLAYEAIE
jgi:molecular chaperone HscB